MHDVLFKIPKPVHNARDAMKGIDIDGETLKATLSAQQYNLLGASFRQGMLPDVKIKYDKLPTDKDRRQWLAQYVVDPKQAKCEGCSTTEAFVESTSESWSGWLPESVIAGPKAPERPKSSEGHDRGWRA